MAMKSLLLLACGGERDRDAQGANETAETQEDCGDGVAAAGLAKRAVRGSSVGPDEGSNEGPDEGSNEGW